MNSPYLLPLSVLDFWSLHLLKIFLLRSGRIKPNLALNWRLRNNSAGVLSVLLFGVVLKLNKALLNLVAPLHLKKLLKSLNEMFRLAVRSRVLRSNQCMFNTFSFLKLAKFVRCCANTILRCICVEFLVAVARCISYECVLHIEQNDFKMVLNLEIIGSGRAHA